MNEDLRHVCELVKQNKLTILDGHQTPLHAYAQQQDAIHFFQFAQRHTYHKALDDFPLFHNVVCSVCHKTITYYLEECFLIPTVLTCQTHKKSR